MAHSSESPVAGYPRLASHIGLYPDFAIYRRFGSLNAQNLLYYQAELVHLEQTLRKQEIADSSSQEGSKSLYARDWYWLKDSETKEDDAQLRTILSVRERLKEYSKYTITFLTR